MTIYIKFYTPENKSVFVFFPKDTEEAVAREVFDNFVKENGGIPDFYATLYQILEDGFHYKLAWGGTSKSGELRPISFNSLSFIES